MAYLITCMIVIDVETTGIYFHKHSLLSIGAVDLLNPSNQFYIECYMWDGAEIYDGDGSEGHTNALDINGFTLEQINDMSKPSVGEAVKKFIEWTDTCKSKVMFGLNPMFYLKFLEYSCLRFNIKWDMGYRGVDLYTLVFAHMINRNIMPEKITGTACLNYVGLPQEPKPHNALNGAKYEAEAFSRLLYGKNLLDEFRQYNIPGYLLKLSEEKLIRE